jgi:CheY-like chemotaxis protein
MGIKPGKVLLVGEAANNSLQLLQWFNRRGCCCQVEQSYRDAFNLVSHTQFDLVLSQYQLPDRTAFPLLDWLVGSSATLFFAARVEDGFLWLKMLERGKRCVGTALLQSNALIEALTKLLDAEVGSYKEDTVDSQVDSASSSRRSALYASST